MSFTCKVAGCRYQNDHITERHCCGTCKNNGHGQIECGKEQLIKDLEKFNYHIIELPCNVIKCIDPHTHTTRGHSCLYCDKRIERGSHQHLKYCPLNENTIDGNSICDNLLDFNDCLLDYIKDITVNNRKYKTVNGGMGCTWLIRNNDGTLEYLFMHSDSWGQYGDDSSHLPRYKAFIYGYTYTLV